MLTITALVLLAAAIVLTAQWVTNRFQDLEHQVREARAQRQEVVDFLNLFTRRLATVAEVEKAMDQVAHYLSDVVNAESVGIFLVLTDPADGRRKLQGAAFAGMFPPFQRTGDIVFTKARHLHEVLRHERTPVGEGILGGVALSERSLLVRDASEAPPGETLPREVRTLIAVPMKVENRLTGVICAVNCREENRHFDEGDVRMLENLSYQAALARNLITIYAERSEQQRLLQELELARQIQNSLLPVDVPEWGEYRVHAFSRSAREVGGDFYDFIRIDADRLMIAVADASGKGIPACMLMAMCQSFLRSSVERYAGLQSLVRDLNRYLYRDSDRAHFVTLALCVIDRRTHVCEYVRAGHTELLTRLPEGICRTIAPDGPALGLLPDELGASFDTLSFCCQPGTSLMLFTDGITEALDAGGREYGLARLEALWRARPRSPADMAATVLADVEAFTGGEPQADDQTIVILSRVTAEAAVHDPRAEAAARAAPSVPEGRGETR